MSDLISFVTTSTTATADAGSSRVGLADNFDTFLTLLTTQMQNQDPLSPLDSTEFTNQLVQFSGVEQQIRTNETLTSMIESSTASTGAALVGYLGQTAEINSAGAGFHGDPVTWKYTLPYDVESAKFVVQNVDGTVVYSADAEATTGGHEVAWDGENLTGGVADQDEVYYASIVATDANGEQVTVSMSLIAQVTGVDLSNGTPALKTPVGIYGYTDVLGVSPS